jgi:hypothetical protein
VLLALVAAVWAAVPVQLPPDESAGDWAEPLALAGLAPGSSGTGPAVVVVAVGEDWQLRVRDRGGVAHVVTVPRPHTAAAREDIAWLASSLVDAVEVPSAPDPAPAPAPVPAPRASQPERIVAAPPRPAPSLAPAVAPESPPETTGLPSATPAVPPPVLPPEPASAPTATSPPTPTVTAPATPPSAPPPATVLPAAESPPSVTVVPPGPRTSTVRLSLALASSLSLRPGLGPTPGFAVDLGLLPAPPLYAGVAVEGLLPAPLTRLGGGETLADVTLAGVVGFHPEGQVPMRVDLAAGMAWRRFDDGDRLVAIVPFPTAAAEVGIAFPLSSWVALEPLARGGVDLRGVDLTEDGGAPVALSPWSAGVGLRLRSTFSVAGAR